MGSDGTWTPVDPLGEALHFLRMSGVFYTRSEFTAPWGLELPRMDHCMMFHVVTSGSCWIETAEAQPRKLQPGDFVLVPHGVGHRLTGVPGARCCKLFDLPREQVSERYEILRHGEGGTPVHMICGAVRFDHPAAAQLIALLPRIIHIEAANSTYDEWIPDTLRYMAAEASALRPGGETIITRLADILVIQALRTWIERDPAAQTGWIGALRDRQIGRAIMLIHRDPARTWTLVSLASAVAMSRSAFAARFASLVGMTAMQYVTQWRMNTALTHLRDEDVSVAVIAERLGYQSEAAFSRTFKRVMGATPGSFRRPSE